jgi:hypothetical protein
MPLSFPAGFRAMRTLPPREKKPAFPLFSTIKNNMFFCGVKERFSRAALARTN